MTLLIVSDTYQPDVNGVARTLRQFAVQLTARGHQVEIVTSCPAASCDDAGIKRHVVLSMPVPGYTALRVGFASVSWFTNLLRQMAADVIYVATETPLGIAALWAAHRCRVPVVSGFHTNFHSYMRDYRLGGLQGVVEAILKAVHQHTSHTVAPSQHTAAMLREIGVERVSVVGRGVDATLFQPAARSATKRTEWLGRASAPVALHVGRLAAEKNLPLLERAFAAFLAVQPQGRCVVVGDGPMAGELRAQHPDWIFAGEQSGAALAAHYASSDVFVFPSTSETFGNVVLEALASGLVIVAYDYAAAHEHIMHGQHGLLAPLHDEAEFLNQVRLAAANWDQAPMRKAARQQACTLTWSTQIDALETVLQQAINTNATALTP